jgi:hypothetical protein
VIDAQREDHRILAFNELHYLRRVLHVGVLQREVHETAKTALTYVKAGREHAA